MGSICSKDPSQFNRFLKIHLCNKSGKNLILINVHHYFIKNHQKNSKFDLGDQQNDTFRHQRLFADLIWSDDSFFIRNLSCSNMKKAIISKSIEKWTGFLWLAHKKIINDLICVSIFIRSDHHGNAVRSHAKSKRKCYQKIYKLQPGIYSMDQVQNAPFFITYLRFVCSIVLLFM